MTDTDHSVAPGCAVGVFRDGATELLVVGGYADVDAGQRIDADTVFYAASVSKQFTALAIAQLVVDRKISLEDDIRKYFPELPEYGNPITVGMLLHHSSGLRDYLTLMRLAGLDPASGDGKAAALRLIFQQQGTNFIPGTDFTYSNSGYLLLGELVARVTGVSFARYARENILEPMGMESSYFLDGKAPESGGLAHAYVPEDGGFAVRDTYPWFSGSGGLMTTMHDVARYEHDVARGHKVWTEAVRKIMLAPGRLNDGTPVVYESTHMFYAAGLAKGWRKGQFFVGHGGGAEGFKHRYTRLPRVGLSVAVFCNRGDWDPLEKADAVIEVLEPGLLVEPTPENLSGHYYSEELSARYELETDGKDLKVTVRPDARHVGDATAEDGARRFVLKASGHSDGSYANHNTQLVPDGDTKGFVLKTSRASGAHVKRVTAGSAPAGKTGDGRDKTNRS